MTLDHSGIKITAVVLALVVAGCTERTSDGREIRHTCIEGHYFPVTAYVKVGNMFVPIVSEQWMCDRERIDTLPLPARRALRSDSRPHPPRRGDPYGEQRQAG